MILRKLKEEDLLDLCNLYTELCDEEGNLEVMKSTFASISNNPDYYLIGAESEGKIVGTLMGIVCHDLAGKYKAFMTIENVIVSEKSRGKGVAKRLFKYIEEIAFERDCRYIYLVSGNNRKVAHKIYEKLGYECNNVTGFKKFLDIPYPSVESENS